MKLVKGRLLYKPSYAPYASRCIDVLIQTMQKATRALDQHEQGAIDELMRIKQSLTEGAIESPLGSYLPDYPDLRKVYRISYSSVDDLSNGKMLIKPVTRLVFEGVRPENWTTLEAADSETADLNGTRSNES